MKDRESIDFKTQDQSVTFNAGSRGELHYQPGDLIGESYKLVGLIGQGGMGVVYHVQHIIMGQHYALKIVAPGHASSQSWRRFELEGRALAKLNHANIVTIYNMGIDRETCPFFVMDLLEGASLSSHIQEKGNCKPDEAIEIFLQVCAGLGSAHRNGIIHRDIKPANIMLTEAKGKLVVKLVDFGMARLSSTEGTGRQALTTNGEILGSPYYMSPEQSCGLPLDLRSDIYSLGCSLFETLTGLVPFRGSNAIQTLMMHQTEAPPTLASLAPRAGFSQSLEAVVGKCLEKNPRDRYQTIESLAIDLKRISEGKPVAAPLVRRLSRFDDSRQSRQPFSNAFDSQDFDSQDFDSQDFDSQEYDWQEDDSLDIGDSLDSGVQPERARAIRVAPKRRKAKLQGMFPLMVISAVLLLGAGGLIVTLAVWQSKPLISDETEIAPVPGSSRAREEGRRRREELLRQQQKEAETKSIATVETEKKTSRSGSEVWTGTNGDTMEKERAEIGKQLKAAPRASLGIVKIGNKSFQRYHLPDNLAVAQIWSDDAHRYSQGIFDLPADAPVNIKLNSMVSEDPKYVDNFANDNVYSLRLDNMSDLGNVLKRLARWKHLDVLVINGGIIDDAGVRALDELKTINTLCLKRLNFSYLTLASMAILKRLAVLQIEDYDQLNELLNAAPASENLIEMRLEGRGANWLTVQSLRSIARNKNLKILGLKSKSIQLGEVGDILSADRLAKLRQVATPVRPAWAAVLSDMKNLERFTFTEPAWSAHDIRQFLEKVPAARKNEWAAKFLR